jgi:uncharacterized protein YwgA
MSYHYNGYTNYETQLPPKSLYNQGAINYTKGQQNQIKGSEQIDRGCARQEEGRMQKEIGSEEMKEGRVFRGLVDMTKGIVN